MGKYEHDFGLEGKTENDAAVLERIAADTERKLEDFQLDSDSRKILNALNVAGAKREDIEEILVLAAKSDALDDQVLIEGKAAGKKMFMPPSMTSLSKTSRCWLTPIASRKTAAGAV